MPMSGEWKMRGKRKLCKAVSRIKMGIPRRTDKLVEGRERVEAAEYVITNINIMVTMNMYYQSFRPF